MRASYLNIAKLHPWWLRLLLLFVIAGPLLGISPVFNSEINPEHPFIDLFMWTGYAIFVWVFIGLVVGIEQLISWLTVAVVFGLPVVYSGAILRGLKIWEIVNKLTQYISKADVISPANIQADLILRLILVMTAVPLLFLTLHSFPATGILRRATSQKNTRHRELWLKMAIYLRVCQHLFETTSQMFLTWREENPKIIIPNFKSDWSSWKSGYIFGGWIGYMRASIWVWSVSLLEQALLFIPVLVSDWKKYIDISD